MNIKFIEDFPKTKWVDFLQVNPQKVLFNSAQERRDYLSDLLAKITSLIEIGRVGQAIDYITWGIYVDKLHFIDNLKRNGILRHSTYLGKKNPVAGIAKHIFEHSDFFKLNTQEKDFYTSLINFEKVFDELSLINREINNHFLRFKNENLAKTKYKDYPLSKLKALLAINESNFLSLKEGDRSLLDLDNYDFYSKEELSEGVSFLVSRYNEMIGFKKYDFVMTDASYANSNSSVDLIKLAAKFKAIKELEMEIEIYGFVCHIDNEKNVIINHPDENFIKAIELSNIHYELQTDSNAYYNKIFNKDVLSLEQLAKIFHESLPNLFELKTKPYERYVLNIPIQFFVELLAKDEIQFFQEELEIINSISNELMIPYESIKSYKIRENFTYYDFVKISRFFILQFILVAQKIRELIGKVNDELIYRTLVAGFSKHELIETLKLISTEEKVNTFLEIVSWSPSNGNPFLDLQYTPIISNDRKYMVSTCILGMSNLTRNIFLSENKAGNNIKAFQMAHHTSIAELLGKVLINHSFKILSEVSIKYKKGIQKESDIDFIAYKDGLLFIAECKDSIHPTDLFEMRTTYVHLKKASSQLAYIQEALEDEACIVTLCSRLGIKREEIKQILPVIVFSNNKFWGYNFEGFPVRNVRELTGFISNGFWNFSKDGKNLHRYKLWEEEIFSTKDLINFCGSKSPHFSSYSACKEIKYKYGRKIYKRSFSLLIERVKENLDKNYRFETVVIDEVNKNEED